MWSVSIVLLNPRLYDRLRFPKRGEGVQPDTFFLQGPHEALDSTVLFGRIRGDVFGRNPLGFF